MAARLRMQGWLRLAAPLHIGGADQDPNGRLDLAEDGLGNLFVPGTSLTGALRAWTERREPQNLRWGFIEPNTPNGQASQVVVHDAALTHDTTLEHGEPAGQVDATAVQTRHGVGIDRYLGTAAPGILHERTAAPAGLYLRLRLDVESTPQHLDTDRAWLAALAADLAAGRIRLGAGKTRGLGRVELIPDGFSLVEQRLDSRHGLLAALRGTDNGLTLADLDRIASPGRTDPSIEVRIEWSPRAPVLVRAPADGAAVQALPLVTAADPAHVRLLLPGSSLKGVLRVHAERIMRTIEQTPLPLPTGGVAQRAAAFLDQHTALPVINALFGAAIRNKAPRPGQPAGPPDAAPPSRADGVTSRPVSAVSAVTVEDCLSETLVPLALWQRLYIDAEGDGEQQQRLPADLRDGLAALGLERADHVAIDRWTGGAAAGRLFSVLEPHGITWQPIRLSVDLKRLAAYPKVPADAAVALLLIVLRDVQAGRVPVGHATNRGCGDITVASIRLRCPDWPDGITLERAPATPAGQRLSAAWRAYLTDGSRR
jgi:CRISPR/Cas system CSM-associated protein Csm3 (group 7 of RAMP superfamily)